MRHINDLLKTLRDKDASDLHLKVSAKAMMRLNGELKYDVFALCFFHGVCAFSEGPANPDFVADSQAVNGVGDIADSADDQLEVAFLRG